MADVRLTPEEIFEVFGDDDPNAYSSEAMERWGETDVYRESRRRTTRYTASDWTSIKADSEQIESDFAALLKAGVSPEDLEAKDLAEQHRQHIERWFYPCSPEMHRGLADMYMADPRFTEHYDRRAEGLARFIHDAIWSNAGVTSV